MQKRSKLDAVNLRRLSPGKWVWERGIGYRRNMIGETGTWYIKYRAPVSGRFPEGVRPPVRSVKERIPNCKNRSQAEGVLMARKGAVFDGMYRPRRKVAPTTITEFTLGFLQAKRRLRTVKKYRQQIEQHLAPHFGRKPLEAISGRDCLDYYNHRLDTDAAVATVNGEMACLKSLFSEAVRAGVCQVNPVKGIKLINPNNVRDRILSDEETARLFAAAHRFTDYVRPLFYVLYHSGMRLGEALALEWADVQPEHSRIVIRESKSGEGRKAPLRTVLTEELVRWKPAAGGYRWVFPGRYDHSVPMQSIRPGWLRLCGTAEVSGLRPHDLRHNFVSMLQARGVSDSIIMSITGHKTHVMLHRYSRNTDALKLGAVEGLPTPKPAEDDNVVAITSRTDLG